MPRRPSPRPRHDPRFPHCHPPKTVIKNAMHPRTPANTRTQTLAAAAVIGTLLTAPAFAATAPSPEEVAKAQSEAYRASVAQDTLRRDAVTVEQELAAIREEIRIFLPDQVKLVDRAFEKLSSLSQNEMLTAVASLRAASSAEDMTARLNALAGAKDDQAEISNSLRQMAVDLKAQQTAKALAEILNKMVRMEATAISAVQRVIDNPSNDGAKLEQQYKAAAAEQDFVNSDLRLLNVDLEELAKNLPQGAQRPAFEKILTLAAQQQLSPNAESALQNLRGGNMPGGMVLQKRVLDTLVAMLAALDSSSSSISEQIKAKMEEVKAAAEAQRELANSEKLEKKPKEMADAQKALADKTAELAALLQPINNKAADEARAAKAQMEEAMKSMRGNKEEQPMAQEQALNAANQLDAAVASLQSQLEKVEGPSMPDTKQELAQALQQLQSATAQAAMEQKNNLQSGQPDPALQDRVEQIQEYAAAVSPEAAAELGEAADKLNNPSPEAQAQAAQDLAEANKALMEQMADLNGNSREQQALTAAEALADKARQEAGKAEDAALPVPPQKPSTAEASKDLAEAQKNAEAAAKAADAAGAPQEIKEALAEAQEKIAEGKAAAAAGKAEEAGKAAGEAEKALGEAKEGLAQAKADAAAQATAAMEAQAAQKAGQPGQPQPGQPQPGQPQNSQQQNGPNQQSQVAQNANNPGGMIYQNSKEIGAQELVNSGGTFVPQPLAAGINATDRAAVAQLSDEKPPRDFVPSVQQYYKNLADGAGQ